MGATLRLGAADRHPNFLGVAMSQDGGLSGAPLADAGLSGGMVQSGAGSSFITAVTPPLAVATGNLSIPQSSNGSDGYLAQGDFSNFSDGAALAAIAETYTGALASGNALINGLRQTNERDATGLLNTTTLLNDFDDFARAGGGTGAPAGWITFHSGTGTSTITTPDKSGGICSISSGATANSFGVLYNQAAIIRPQGGAWYFACYLKLTSAMDANATAGVYLQDTGTSRTIFLGFIGSLNSTNFICQHSGSRSGSALNLGVAIDTTTYHFLQAWGDGTSQIKARIDRGTTFTGTQSLLFTGCGQPLQIAGNGATAVARTLNVDWIATAWA